MLKENNWLNDHLNEYPLTFKKYLEKPEIAKEEYVFENSFNIFPTKHQINDSLCNMNKKLNIEYQITVPSLMSFGISHTRLS